MPRTSIPNAEFLKIDMQAELKDRFRRACQNAGHSMAQVIRLLIEEFVNDAEGGTNEEP